MPSLGSPLRSWRSEAVGSPRRRCTAWNRDITDARRISKSGFAALARGLELTEDELEARFPSANGDATSEPAPASRTFNTASGAHPLAPLAIPPNPIKLRRLVVGLAAADVVERTGGEISLKLLSRLENGHVSALSLRKIKFAALADALGLTEPDLQVLIHPTGEAGTPRRRPVAPQFIDDVRQSRQAQIKRSVDVAISKLRDELERMNDHLSALQADLERFGGR